VASVPTGLSDSTTAARPATPNPAWSAWRVVVSFGAVSLAADMVYEGARSITGPLLAALGASAMVVGGLSCRKPEGQRPSRATAQLAGCPVGRVWGSRSPRAWSGRSRSVWSAWNSASASSAWTCTSAAE
jgi:hypothetical protein